MKINKEMKKILLSFFYSLVVIGIGWVLYVIIMSNINSFFYDYKLKDYQHEIDFLFQPQTLKHLKVKYVYKSGEQGAIYYLNCDTLSNFVVIEASNYQGTFFEDIDIKSIERIDLTQNKTYITILNNPFPTIQLALNPKQSLNLNITFEKPDHCERTVKKSHFCYLIGKYSFVSFGNTQNVEVVSFRGNDKNEILVFKHTGKMYFVVQTKVKKSLLEIVNSEILAD